MSEVYKWEGIFPAVCVVYTDKSCKLIDEDAYRVHVRNLIRHGVAGLVVGGHASEIDCLSMNERKRVIQIAKEESKGSIPVVGGVTSNCTWMAIEEGKHAKAAGADAILFMPPTIVAWDPATGDDLLVEHIKRFDQQADIPFIYYGGPPGSGAVGTFQILPKTFKRLALETKNMVAWKITTRHDIGAFRACHGALIEAESKTGRHVAALIAGDFGLAEMFKYGADGTLNGGDNYRAPEDIAIFKAVRRGDLTQAFAIQERLQPIADAIRGIINGRGVTYFHFRYKVATWLLGMIPRPHMRLPQMPISKEDVELIRTALIKSGMNPVREAESIDVSEM